MHYYKRNIGDYSKKAGRLSILQHGVYNLLIDACYDRERFPTREEAADWVWASTPEEENAVDFVLRKFFTLDEKTGIYTQARIAEEIEAYRQKAETNKRIADEREAKRKENETNRERTVNEPPPNQEPGTTSNTEPNGSVGGTALPPPCPHQEIIDLYHESLPMGTQVREWGTTRAKSLQARWREKPERQSLDWWRKFFRYVSESEFLTGQAPPAPGRDPFVVSLDWLIGPQNFAKVVEGKYHRRTA